ncbi:kinase-like domain-containing protein [Boletus edulis BED1]|uniref:Kinase-like domain-containing protein n=1 Tax=Boletus edulis BED1 TaxID=1328754 RepID=A0AAD4BUT0_BOLED|nr:kinase-like domain-containing protein [Boletus edulis BED1]
MAQRCDEVPRRLGNYWLRTRLGSGYSGSIFSAYHVHTGDWVAIKVQDINHECPTNRYEEHFYPMLQGAEGMPGLFASGVEGKWHYLVITLLGSSLDNIYRNNGQRTLDLRSVCSIAYQVISRLRTMHHREILHRDVQLGNCAIGCAPNETMIYMIDFGFSKRYIDPVTRRHIPDSKQKRDFLGNYWFTSVGVHCKGKVPSRRDDLEAAALMFIHLLTPGGLLWTRNGVPKTDEQHMRIKRAKQSARPEDLCRGMPSEFEEFLRYCRRLKFAEQPDYEHWMNEFKALAHDNGFTDIHKLIWPPPPQQAKPVPRAAPRRPACTSSEMENVLQDLAKLQLNHRPALADQTNTPTPGAQAAKPNDAEEEDDVIDLTGDSTQTREKPKNSAPHTPVRIKKFERLWQLRVAVSKATDNVALSKIVADFATVLKETGTSKTLTIEGFSFLDALRKRLGDPAAFMQPMRTSRARSTGNLDQEVEPQPAYVKLDLVARLKREVARAPDNKALAQMVADFGAVTNRSSSRTITKDGFAFLEGLAARLQALS